MTAAEESEILAPLGEPVDLQHGGQRNRIINYGQVALRQQKRKLRSYQFDPDASYPEIPGYLGEIASRIVQAGLLASAPTLVTVNEYLPGQGIQPHLDLPNAGPEIAVLALSSSASMRFTYRDDVLDVPFPRYSLLVFSGEHRYKWKHAVAPVEQLRHSVVFRQV